MELAGDNPFAQEAWAQKEKITVAAAERLRTQNREGIWRDVRLIPAANESRDERRAQALCVHHR